LHCGDFGIGLSGNSALFVKNTVLDCCVGGENGGISALGASIALEKNVARRCGDGIRVNGNSAFLSGNVASQNAVDGFEIAGGSTIALSGNVAIGNGAEGIDNEGTSTALIGNVCKGNRIDIASANAPQQFEDNVYVTGGPNVAPEVD
jgi:parallel beta-helix repeat protein